MDEDDIGAERRRAEAAQWFARLKTRPVSHGTLKDFFAWRRHRGNAEAFTEAERFWSEAGKVGERPAILRAVDAASHRGARRRRFGVAKHPLALGVAVLAVVVLTLVSARMLRHPGQAIQTATGESRAIALDDGSHLNLNTETAVNVTYTPQARKLVLKSGEALFSVARDKSRPFTVAAGGVTVTATGTRFDVAMRQDRTVVTLIEGHVTIAAPDGTTAALSSGEQWRWPRDGAPVQKVRTENVTAWTQGRVVFDDTALVDAIAEVNRYSGKPVLLDAPALGSRRLSGSFQAGDSDSFVTAVTAFLPLQQRRDSDGRIHLVASGDPQ